MFIPHTKKLGKPYPPHDWDAYFTGLHGLPDELRPKAICLFHIDIRNGLHHVLRQFGLPIFTVGLASHPKYAARFYDLISRFEFATSSFIGSQLWYCEELGVKYFLFGEPPEAVTTPDEVLKKSENLGTRAKCRNIKSCTPKFHPVRTLKKIASWRRPFFYPKGLANYGKCFGGFFLNSLFLSSQGSPEEELYPLSRWKVERSSK